MQTARHPLLALLALGFATPTSPAYTLNPLAPYLARYDGGVEYDFVLCDSADAEVQVTMTLPPGDRQERRSLDWFFRRDTITRRRWDSILAYQEIHSGDPAVYSLPTGRMRTIGADGRVTDSVVCLPDVQASEPMLFPRKNNRILFHGESLPSIESTGDTTFSLGTGSAVRSIRIRRIDRVGGNAKPKPAAPSKRRSR